MSLRLFLTMDSPSVTTGNDELQRIIRQRLLSMGLALLHPFHYGFIGSSKARRVCYHNVVNPSETIAGLIAQTPAPHPRPLPGGGERGNGRAIILLGADLFECERSLRPRLALPLSPLSGRGLG